MTTIEHIIFYEPEDVDFRGDRVRTEFRVEGETTLIFGGDRGDTTVDSIFYGFVKAYKAIYGDDEVEVLFDKFCCENWDYLDEDWDYDED